MYILSFLQNLGSSWRKKIASEQQIMSVLQHPFLVNLKYAFQVREKDSCRTELDTNSIFQVGAATIKQTVTSEDDVGAAASFSRQLEVRLPGT